MSASPLAGKRIVLGAAASAEAVLASVRVELPETAERVAERGARARTLAPLGAQR